MFAERVRKGLLLPALLAVLYLPTLSTHAQTVFVYGTSYEKWLNEDVRWIITDQERADFRKLSDDQQRDQFIEEFWARRNPVPGTSENTFKVEHYRRLAYANQQFAESTLGWKTDRGRFYIMYGPPGEIVRRLSSDRPEPDSIQRGCFDTEEWHWNYIEGLGRDATLKFVETCGSGEYRLPVDESKLRMR